MTWAKFCDGFLDHPKVLRAGEDASNLFMRGCIWCNKHLTDGAIPREALRALTTRRDAPALAAKLVSVRLWEETADGWQVHDWSDHNPTRESVEGRREKTREKVASWREKRGNAAGNASCNHGCNPVTCEACNPVRNPVGNHGGNPAPVPTRPDQTSPKTPLTGSAEGAIAPAPPPAAETASGAHSASTTTDPAPAKRKRTKPAPQPDTLPMPGTLARRVFDAITGDRALCPIVGNPGDASERWADPATFPGVDVLAEVMRAGEYAATKPGRYTDGRAFLRGWLQRKADEVAAQPKPAAPAPHVAPVPANRGYVPKTIPLPDYMKHLARPA